MDRIHHIAVQVNDIAQAVSWYLRLLNCQVHYQDDPWAQIKFANMSLALITRDQHPPHIGIERGDAERFGALKAHRNGNTSFYINDPDGDAMEILAVASLKEAI